jgi:cytoskeletal protein CcmA (bactofilin family)
MFGSNNNKETMSKNSRNGIETSSHVNMISTGTVIQGEINSEGDVRIDGVVKGRINTKAKVVLGKTGRVEGNIECQNGDISGKIEGRIAVKDLLFLKSSGKIEGEILTAKLVVESGATFDGTCNMTGKAMSNKERVTAPSNGEALRKVTPIKAAV